MDISKKDFGDSFRWGVSTAAYQIEGAHITDGKGLSVWDVFTQKKGKIYNSHHANTACDHYNRYQEDILLMKYLHIPNYRLSISWSRIFPHGTGPINFKGVDFYNRLIDFCLGMGIEPWITLYHWDLPHELEKKGGWTNREVTHWFGEYAAFCIRTFGDRVKHWMILNEPPVQGILWDCMRLAVKVYQTSWQQRITRLCARHMAAGLQNHCGEIYLLAQLFPAHTLNHTVIQKLILKRRLEQMPC